MSKNNPVFQVLVTSGNKALLPKDKRVTDLEPGQIGVFDYDTNISVDATAKPRNYYFAVGLDGDGDGQTDDIKKSRGSHIQLGNITSYTFRPHTPGRPMKVKLTNYVADCDTEYGVKLQIRNSEIYKIQGYNPFVKSYVMKTSCCNGCTPTCPSGDANQITKQLFIQASNDPSGFVKVSIVPRGNVTAAGVTPQNGVLTLADLDTIMAYNKTKTNVNEYVYTDLEFETVPVKIAQACGINLNYFYPRESFATLTKVGDFKCSGEVVVTQEAVNEEGLGYDLRQDEVFASGWDVSPYRVSSVTGMEIPRNYTVDPKEKYDLIHLAYEQKSDGAWLRYSYDEATTIAIPSKDTVTRDALVTLLDELNIVRFDALKDDAKRANTDPTVVETTTAIDDVNKDGLA